MKTFPELAEAYLACRATCQAHHTNIRRIAAAVGDVSVERLNAYLKQRLSERSSITVKNERGMMLSVWRHAYEMGLIDEMPRGVVRFKVARKPTRAWTIDQLRTAVDATFELDDLLMRCGASRGYMLRAWILLGYECGARMGDLWSFSRDNLDGRVLRWTQGKTGDPISRTLSSGCVQAVQEMLAKSPDGRVLGWTCTQRHGTRIMREFLKKHDLPGTSKWLRRSGATHIEIERPGSARLHLGHRSVGLAERSYIDWGQVRDMTPSTPELMTR